MRESQSIRPGDWWTYDTSMSTPERQKYKIAGPATWELIRAAYLAGESAPALAERFGVSAHAIRKRITVEKWTKRAYAEALEARGLEAPARPKTLNVAERFAANYAPPAPPPASQPEEHPFMALVAALKEAAGAAEAGQAHAGDVLAAQEPSEAAAVLERQALAQAGAALSKGRASDAKTFAALAEQMRKRVETVSTSRAVEEERSRMAQEEAEQAICDLFAKAAYIANAMVHAPTQAPAAFQGLVKAWREKNLGEGEADADRAAALVLESQAAFLDGRYEDMLPDDVRRMMDEAWRERRAAMEGDPLIPKFWE